MPKADVHKGKPFYSRLAKDISENGLHYPLLVIHATRRELIERMKICTDEFCELPFDESKGNLNIRLYVIWGGSNRVRVAEELGYTHVDCVIVESFDKAVSLQRTHRKSYTNKYYIPPRPASFQVLPSELTVENSPSAGSRDALWQNSLPNLLETLQKPDAQANDWINFGVCKEALGDHLQAARAFLKAHELDPDRFSTFTCILRNLYLARDFDLLVDYLTYCKHFSPKFTELFSKEPFFAELFAHEPFKTLADPKQTLPPAETDDPEDEPAVEVQKSNGGVMDEDALSVLKEAVEQNPENEEALFSYGLGLKAMERYGEAAEIFIKAQGVNPQNKEICSMVFLCLFRSENREMLLNFAGYCVESSPDLIVAFSENPIYSELFDQSEFKELHEVAAELSRLQAEDSASSEQNEDSIKGSAVHLMQQFGSLLKDEALLPILKNAVEKNPSDEIAWFNYATSLQMLERYEEAAEAFLKVQEINPTNEAVYPEIFYCLFCVGHLEMLLEFAHFCSQLSPDLMESISRDVRLCGLFNQPGFKLLLSREPGQLLTPKDRPRNMDKTFITGVDGNQEWMLKWWYRHVTAYNPDIHITICDFGGMSPKVRKWARAHADHFIQYPKHPECAWFYKTQAMIDSPYKYTCWMDVDCQVIKPIQDIFNYASPNKIGLTEDTMHRRQHPSEHWWATGVNLIMGGSPLLHDWHSISSRITQGGDQEALHLLLQQEPERGVNIIELPIEYQWLRLQLANRQDNKDKKVIHWTGPTGKAHVREQLMTFSDSDFAVFNSVNQGEQLLCTSVL